MTENQATPQDRIGTETYYCSIQEKLERGELSATINTYRLSSSWFVMRHGECIAAGTHGPACDMPHEVSRHWVQRILADNAGPKA